MGANKVIQALSIQAFLLSPRLWILAASGSCLDFTAVTDYGLEL